MYRNQIASKTFKLFASLLNTCLEKDYDWNLRYKLIDKVLDIYTNFYCGWNFWGNWDSQFISAKQFDDGQDFYQKITNAFIVWATSPYIKIMQVPILLLLKCPN